MTMKDVLAVVVTYNRLSDLKDCIQALKSQTKANEFDIFVVNNGSTDGTAEYLESENGIQFINQENLGGAGGFYTGMKYAYENNYTWIWLMDDDGLPEKKQLEELLLFHQNHPRYYFLNALVLNKDSHNEFAFNSPILGTVEDTKKLEFLNDFIKPFNGTFIHRKMISDIGFIKKEMFIWGDEREYTSRARIKGYYPVTVTSAIHYHPKEKGKSVYAIPFLKSSRILLKPEKLSHIYYRNEGFIQRNYGKGYHGILTRIKFVFYNIVYLLRVGNMTELKKFCVFYRQGVKGMF